MNQRCIVAHPKLVWSRARILQRNGQATVLVRTDEGEEIEVKTAQCCEVGENTLADVNAVADLCLLDELHAGLIYDHLRERYFRDEIYTYIGPIVVSVNPFCRLANIPTIESISSYLEKDKEELAPHLYHIGKLAYQSMRSFGRSQAVIISGESGAGKTEATKIVLRFLTTVSSLTQASERGREIAQLILATNPILEAFGNAKTVRNNNSSRFGKFIKIIFDRNSNICGGEVVNYLLEKTRIVYQAPTERNYHIFYQLLAGTTDEEKKELHLRPGPADYAYLVNGNVVAPGVDDKEWMKETFESFRIMGFTEEEILDLKRILSGILLLGNLTFQGEEKAIVSDEALLAEILDLFDLKDVLGPVRKALEAREFKSGGRSSGYSVPLTLKEAIDNRNALAKAIYYNLFDWLVNRLSSRLVADMDPEESDLKFIGVLDIYGFEIFENNSLEQFCINYANEKLHQQFTHHMFKSEQEEYKKEGIPWKDVQYSDNTLCINLMEKHPEGMISLLDEEGRVPKGTDKGFLDRIDKLHAKNQFYERKPQQKDSFNIKHFAGTVTYQLNGFLEKNKDTLQADIIKLMSNSRNPILSSLFYAMLHPAGGSKNDQRPESMPTRRLSSMRNGGGGNSLTQSMTHLNRSHTTTGLPMGIDRRPSSERMTVNSLHNDKRDSGAGRRDSGEKFNNERSGASGLRQTTGNLSELISRNAGLQGKSGTTGRTTTDFTEIKKGVSGNAGGNNTNSNNIVTGRQNQNNRQSATKTRAPMGRSSTSTPSSSASKVTVCSSFRADLTKLVNTLSSAERHYVRCIKPNDLKSAHNWDGKKCMEQLSCNGIFETVAVRKAGFSNRIPYEIFLQSYAMLVSSSGGDGGRDAKDRVKRFFGNAAFLQVLGEDSAFGETKVFFNDAVLTVLQAKQVEMFESSAIILQSYFRVYFANLIYQKLKLRNNAAKTMQRFCRVMVAQKKLAVLFEERRKRQEEERRRREEEERKRREEEERKRKEEEERKRREEERRRKEEEERKRREEEERKRKEEEERKRKEEEERRRLAEEKRKREEEERNRKIEEERRKRIEEEERREAERKRKEEERKREMERKQEEQRQREEEERREKERRATEAEAERRRRDEERRRKEREEDERRRAEEEEAKTRKSPEEIALEKRKAELLEKIREKEEKLAQKKRDDEKKREDDRLKRESANKDRPDAQSGNEEPPSTPPVAGLEKTNSQNLFLMEEKKRQEDLERRKNEIRERLRVQKEEQDRRRQEMEDEKARKENERSARNEETRRKVEEERLVRKADEERAAREAREREALEERRRSEERRQKEIEDEKEEKLRQQMDLERRKRELNDAIAAADALTTENGYTLGLAAGGSGRLMHPHKHKHSPFLEELQLESPMERQPSESDVLRRRANSRLKDPQLTVELPQLALSTAPRSERDTSSSSGGNTPSGTLGRSQGTRANDATSGGRARAPSLRESMTLQALLSPRNGDDGAGHNHHNSNNPLHNSGANLNSNGRPPSWMSNGSPNSPRNQPANASDGNSPPSLHFKNRGGDGEGGANSRDNSRDLTPLVRAGRSPSLRASMTAKALVSPRAMDQTHLRDSRDRDGNNLNSNSPSGKSPSWLDQRERGLERTASGNEVNNNAQESHLNTNPDANKNSLGKSGNAKMRAPTWLLQFNQDMVDAEEAPDGAPTPAKTPTIITKGPDPLAKTPTLQKSPSGNQVHPPSAGKSDRSSLTNSSGNVVTPISSTPPISIGTRKDSGHNKTLPTGKPLSVKINPVGSKQPLGGTRDQDTKAPSRDDRLSTKPGWMTSDNGGGGGASDASASHSGTATNARGGNSRPQSRAMDPNRRSRQLASPDSDANKPPKRMSSVKPKIKKRDTILLSLTEDQKNSLEAFLGKLGLLELKSVFVDEMIDKEIMLGWKDQTEIERELGSLGITQQGVVSRLVKGLREEKGEDQKPAEQSDSLISKLFGFSSGSSATSANTTSQPTVTRNESSSALLGNKPVPVNPNEATQPQPVLGDHQKKVKFAIMRANIIARKDARSTMGAFAKTMDISIKIELKNKEKVTFDSFTVKPTSMTNNTTPLKPSFLAEDGSILFLDKIFEEGMIMLVTVTEVASIVENKLGETILGYNEIINMGNGDHWITIKYNQVHYAGDLFFCFRGLPRVEPKFFWGKATDSIIAGCDIVTIGLKKDYEPGIGGDFQHATLIRTKTKIETITQTAVLCLPSISDCFWNLFGMELFLDEGYHFYFLEPRRYGRNLRVDLGQHPNYCEEISEYYEEITKAIFMMKKFDKIENILLYGQGFGAVLALHYASDHNERVDGLLLNSPLISLSPSIPAFSKPYFNTNLTETGKVCAGYHQSLHRSQWGEYEWDLRVKPIDGYPLYVGWIEAMQQAAERREKFGLNVECPVLVLTSETSKLQQKYHVDMKKSDCFVNVQDIVKQAPKWGAHVKVKQLADATHDVLLSSSIIQDTAYNEIFNYFCYFFNSEKQEK